MRKLLILLFLFSVLDGNSQTEIERSFNSITDQPAEILKSGQDYFLAGYTRFNFDSSFISLIKLNSSFEITDQHAWKPVTNLNYVRHSAWLGNGIVITGGSSPGSFGGTPSLTYVDTTGTITWNRSFPTFPFSNNYLNVVVAEGNQFTAYSTGDNLVQGFTRIDGTSSVPVIDQTAFDMNEQGSIQIASAVVAGTQQDQILGGSVYTIIVPEGSDAMLARISGATFTWGKRYHFGSTTTEAISQVIKTSDNNYVALGTTEDISAQTAVSFLIKVAADGTLIWCKKISDTAGRCQFYGLTELENDQLLISGITPASGFLFTRFNPDGQMLTSRSWTSGNGFQILDKMITDDNGMVTAMGGYGSYWTFRIDSSLDACNFSDYTSLVNEDFAVTVNDFTMNSNAVTPTDQAAVFGERSLTYTATDYCAAGIETVISETPFIYPNPSSGIFTVLIPADWKYAAIEVYDLTGKTIYKNTGPNGGNITLPQFPAGIYSFAAGDGMHLWKTKIISIR